ncbi:MAG TPA: hypothetical protein VK136_09940 [Bacillota bacterium]|nr:hypothetical protein [Bacillota bacterium]
MAFELLYELLNETSPFYFYFSLFLSALGAIKWIQFDHWHKFIGQRYVYTKETHAIQIQSAPVQKSINETTDIMDWMIKKAKRFDAPDDDTDDHPSLFSKR